VKNSVYVVPDSDQGLEDLQWIVAESLEGGGDAIICRAEFLAGLDDEAIRARLAARTPPPPARARVAAASRAEVQGRTWVTREGVFVDRIASAWLIARFIDHAARFHFVSAAGYRPRKGELRFDMYDGEFMHVGDRCTFEVLVDDFALDDPALHAIAEVVHDIDVKDGKFARDDAPGIERVLAGMARAHPTDAARLERGRQLFDELYAMFSIESALPDGPA